jgi:hypothetical protein
MCSASRWASHLLNFSVAGGGCMSERGVLALLYALLALYAAVALMPFA